MTEKQMQDYIELQRRYIQITLKRGHTMEELDALRNIENFETGLDCNKETETYINGKFVAVKETPELDGAEIRKAMKRVWRQHEK